MFDRLAPQSRGNPAFLASLAELVREAETDLLFAVNFALSIRYQGGQGLGSRVTVCFTSCGLLVGCCWDSFGPIMFTSLQPSTRADCNCTNMSSQYVLVLVHQMVAVNVTKVVQRLLGAAGFD